MMILINERLEYGVTWVYYYHCLWSWEGGAAWAEAVALQNNNLFLALPSKFRGTDAAGLVAQGGG